MEWASMGARVPDQYALEGELDPERFGDCLLRAKRSDGRAYSILRLPRASLALHADWQQQVQRAVQLRHPHIMQVHEVFVDDLYLNVVLDDCTGGSLQQYVQGKQQEQHSKSRLTEERARWLFQQLVLAVDYLHSMHVSGLNLQDVMAQAPASNPQQKMVRVCCPLIKLTGSLPCSTNSSSSSWLPAVCESEQLADIAACGVVLLNMLGGRLKEYSWGYSSSTSSTSSDIATTSGVASAAVGGRTSTGASTTATASAEVPYLLPADYADVLSKDCQQLLQRLLSPSPLGVVLSAAELLQDSWVQRNLTPAAASLNHRCRGMRPLWKEAEQQLPGILAAAASSELGFKVWQHLTDMQEELEGGWQQQLDASLFGCSSASVAVHAAQGSQQQQRLWACSLLPPGPACAGRDALGHSQLAEHAAGVQHPGAPADMLPLAEAPQLLRDEKQQQDQQHQELPQQHVHEQQSTQQHWPTDTRELEATCRMFTRVPSPGFMAALQQLYAGQGHAADSSSRHPFETAGPVGPVVGLCLQPPMLLLEEPRHGTLASWLAKQQQGTQQRGAVWMAPELLLSTSLPPAWPVLQQLLLDVAAGLQALHSQDPPLVHGCVNAGAVHLLQPLPTLPFAASIPSVGLGFGDPQCSMLSVLPSGQQPQQQQQQVAQLSLLWPWRQAVSRTRSAHPWLSAPEVLQQAATPTPASDVYGLGVLMLQVLTGWVPGVSKAAGAGAATQQSSGWSLDSPVPGAALAAAVEKAAWSGNQQGLQQLCADLEAMCGLSWRIFSQSLLKSSSSSSMAAGTAAVGLPAGFLGLMWACLSESPAARPSLAEVIAQLQGMDGPASKATTSASGTLATDLSMLSRTDAQQPSTSGSIGPGSAGPAAGSEAACTGAVPAAQHLADCSELAEATEAAADSKAAPHVYGGAAALVKLLGSTVGAATQHNAARALAHMTANSAGDRAAVVAAGGAAAFVKLLGSSNNPGMQQTAAKALLNLAAGEAASHGALLEAGAVAGLLKLLTSSSDAGVQQQAARALAELACRDAASHCGLRIAEAQSVMAELLRSSSDVSVQLRAARVVVATATGGAGRVDTVCDAGGVAALVQLLEGSSDTAVQMQAARALANIATREDGHGYADKAVGDAVSALVKQLSSSADAAVVLQATTALADFLKVSPGGPTASEAFMYAAQRIMPSNLDQQLASAAQTLVKLLESSVAGSSMDSGVQLQACRALTGIMARGFARADGVSSADSPAVSERQVNRTSDLDVAVQRRAASPCADLAAGAVTSRAAAYGAGGVAALVAVLNSTADAAVRLQAAEALAGLAAGNLTGQAAVCAGGGVAALVAALDRGADAAVQLQAASALAGLAAGAPASQAAVCAGGGVAAFVAVLNSTADAAVQLQAASALAGLAAGDLTSQAAVCAGGGVAALVAVLHRPSWCANAAVELQAVEALAYLARGGPTSQAAVRHAGCIPALVAVLNRSADAAVQLQAFTALSLLVKPSGCWLGNQPCVLAAGGMLDALRSSGDAHVLIRQASIIADLAAHNRGCRHAMLKAGGVTVFKRLLRSTTNAGVQVHASVALDALKRRPPQFNNNKNITRTPRHPPRFTCF